MHIQKQIQLDILPPLATDKVPEPWKSTLQRLATTTFIPLLNNSALQRHIDLAEQDWWISLWWVVSKKWNKRLAFPGKPKDYRFFLEPRGELFLHSLELCQSCYDRHPLTDQRYSHPSDWFLGLMIETKQQEIDEILDNEAKGKTAFLKRTSSLLGSLRSAENSVHSDVLPHLHYLFEASLSLQAKDRSFRNQHWKPYLEAIRKWQNAMRENSQEAFVEDGWLYRRTANGRGKTTYR